VTIMIDGNGVSLIKRFAYIKSDCI